MNPNITIEGNLAFDPELRFADSGMAYCRLRVCVSDKDKNGVETTSYYDAVAFGKLAENVANSLHKGNAVIVFGQQAVRDYEKKDGTKGTSVEIRAREVAPSLKFATVTIERNPRNEDGGRPAPRQTSFAGANAGGYDDF